MRFAYLNISYLPPFLLLFFGPLASAASAQPMFKNENAIVFETMDGQKTDALEGFIEVPENRSKPQSRMIPVRYVRFPATGSAKDSLTKRSPIIYLSGGPGGSGIQTARYPGFRYPLFMALRQHGDVIALDQRGTGASKIVDKCQSGQHIPLTEVATDQQLTVLYQNAARACVQQWTEQGVDVNGYTTLESARDIDDLRRHLEADKVVLWGISYGSHLALASLKAIPNSIEKVVIASAEGLNQTVKLPSRTDAYFQRLQTAVNSQPAAASAYPDIKALMTRVHHQLEVKPILLAVPVKDSEPVDLLFQRYHMQILASSMIADPHRGVPTLLSLYWDLDKGIVGPLTQVLRRGYFNDAEISFDVMPLAMDVASGITDERLELVNQQAKSSLLGLALNFPMPHLNKKIVDLDLGGDFRTEAVSDVPTLLLTGTLDGRTYIDAQVEATAGLSKLTHVLVENAGHNLFMRSPEVTEVIHRFLSGDRITKKRIKIELPEFVPAG
ncbi:MAG: pimeloyl-ACP methyl ester carboxylesterase [Candidatus Azotimanducaceae bacterium]|jgi:pimeloyl-ACP methyl ester carboxylesterase